MNSFPAALAAKAALAVVAAERRADMPNDAPLLIVPDVLAALRALAAAARARTHAKVIGVTGSVGKTSTKEALRLALSKDGETHASVASYNNHWGVPLSLARCPAGAHYARAGNGHEPCRRDRAAVAARAPACGDHHHHRAGASRIFRHPDQNRRRQSRDLIRIGAGRRRRHQSRHRAVRASQTPRQGSERRACDLVRRARQGRCASDQMRSASGLLYRARPIFSAMR